MIYRHSIMTPQYKETQSTHTNIAVTDDTILYAMFINIL